jgi:hypothetical protein
MSASVEHSGVDLEPIVDTRWHRLLISFGVGAMFALLTLGYVRTATVRHDPAMWTSIAPFIAIASIIGVGLPTYLATDFVHHRGWLQAAGASCLALFLGFLIFWSAALVATTDSSSVRLGSSPVVASIRFDPVAWRTDVAARLAMARDICSTGQLRGLTVGQVRSQLGEPMIVVGPGVTEMCYALTPPGQSGNTAVSKAKQALLRVFFSPQGRVASVALVGD